MRIEWATHWELREISDDNDAVVWVDLARADAIWQLDNLYIPAGAPDHRPKHEKFESWLIKATERVEMAHVAVSEGNSLSFTNGRHRFAWMRDHSAQAVPFTIWKGQARRLAKLVGTSLKVCEVKSPAG